jgi:alginate O-acetyltransferase complex protein AlgI
MEFLSIPYAVLIVLAFMLYYAKSSYNWQRMVLLLTSVIFIGFYHLMFLAVAVGITLLTFYTGRLLSAKRGKRSAPCILTGGIIALAGVWLAARYWSPVFPLGISFYTFQALSYLIEIYWEEEDPEPDLLNFTLYMLLFMKFLSGPIERGLDMLPQLKKAHPFDSANIVYGMKLVLVGVFMKLVIADRLAPSMNAVFSAVRDASGMQLLEATLLYPLQLYADFAGYTNMAIGFAMMFGFKLSPNFNRPFVALTTGELWRRWHMSLSFWVRDYVFVPLTVETRRWKAWGTYFSLLVTFVVIGIWHGAGWTFAIYGLIQGVIIIYETAAARGRDYVRQHVNKHVFTVVSIIRTYVLFAFSLLFFRVAKMGDIAYVYRHVFDGFNVSVHELRLSMPDNNWIAFGVAVLLMFVFEYFNSKHDLLALLSKQKAWLRWAVYYAVIIVIFLFGAFGVENFIYIQF